MNNAEKMVKFVEDEINEGKTKNNAHIYGINYAENYEEFEIRPTNYENSDMIRKRVINKVVHLGGKILESNLLTNSITVRIYY